LCDVHVITTYHFPLRAGSGRMVCGQFINIPLRRGLMLKPCEAPVRKVYELIVLTRVEPRATEHHSLPFHVPALLDVSAEVEKLKIKCLGPDESSNTELAEWRKNSKTGDQILVYQEHWIAYTNEDGPSSGRHLGKNIVRVKM
jgi:hypothetical protein